MHGKLYIQGRKKGKGTGTACRHATIAMAILPRSPPLSSPGATGLLILVGVREHVLHVEEWNSVGVPSRRGSSEWISGCVDNRSGLGEEDHSNTGQLSGRELVLVFSVP